MKDQDLSVYSFLVYQESEIMYTFLITFFVAVLACFLFTSQKITLKTTKKIILQIQLGEENVVLFLSIFLIISSLCSDANKCCINFEI